MWSVCSELTGKPHSRRELLRVGALGAWSLATGMAASPAVHAANQAAPTTPRRSCVFLFLFGGPSQIDLWDMKPDAPIEIRGEFRPIATRVPGIQVCEHLPKLAGQMDKLCLLRSMTHRMNVHGPACSEVFSGREYFGAPTTDESSPQDWPSLSALAMRYGTSRGGLPPSVVVPWYLQFPGQARLIAGQTGGRMGHRHNAMLVQGDDRENAFQVDGFQLAESVSLARIQQRRELLRTLQTDGGAHRLFTRGSDDFERHHARAYSLLENRAGELLDLERETVATRARYGKSLVGQSLLMARRLVEAGVSLVTVNWQDETKTDGVNTCWDTHQDNFAKLKNLLCPMLDESLSAFLADLAERGLLDTTLVVAVGEFGRTPRMGQFSQSSNTKKTGRDHWPQAFTALVAGGGVRGGQVYGQTDPQGAFVTRNPVSPSDLAATVLHQVGIDPRQRYTDEMNSPPHLLSDGVPLQSKPRDEGALFG